MTVRTEWTVRRATIGDAPEIARINTEGWRTAYRGLLPDDYLDALRPAARADRVAGRIAQPDPAGTFVAVDGAGRIGAFASVLAARSATDRDPDLPTGELASIYADPARRGTGAGFAAHRAGLAHLAGQGFRHAILWVLTGNAASRRFYEARGWHCDGAGKRDVLDGFPVDEVRYSIPLGPAAAQSSMT